MYGGRERTDTTTLAAPPTTPPMDAGSHQLSHGNFISLENVQENSSSVNDSELLEMQCIVCTRTFIPVIEVNEGLDSMAICRECKSLVVDENETSLTARRQRRRRSRYGSSESVEEDVFSQQFSQLIGLVRHNRDLQLDDDTTVAVHQRSSYASYRNWSRRARRAHSDTDNESIDHMESLFGETDSHITFGGYGGDSDASVDGHSILEREIFSPLDIESHVHTDTDINPMHAGIDQWTSDDQDEYGDWEEVSVRDASIPHGRIDDAASPNGSATSPQSGAWLRWRVRHVDLFTDLDEMDASTFTGNSGDYLDARGFEELLEQLAEADSSRRGAPPAAASFVRNLPRLIISKHHVENGPLICAVCKDPLSIDTEARQLPCSHLYHPSCILPWLGTRNSCPVCRYELPTDDPEYEEGKRNDMINEIHEIRQQDTGNESYSVESSDVEGEADECEFHTVNQADVDDGDHAVGRSNHGGNGGWIFIAAAPFVSIVGIAIAMWVKNSMAGGSIQGAVRDNDVRQSQRSRVAMAHSNRSRRWWSLF